jgi:hypothetical protein
MEVEISSGDAKAIFQHVGEEEVFVFREREAKQKPGGKGNRRAKGLAPRDGWGSGDLWSGIGDRGLGIGDPPSPRLRRTGR